MRVVDLASIGTEPIVSFDSIAASSRLLAGGEGQSHVHWLEFEAGGRIGEHPTGFGQLFVVLEGSGWVAGADGRRVEIGAGQAAFFERGEVHSKGSDRGMKVMMVQVTDLRLHAEVDRRTPRAGRAVPASGTTGHE